MTIRRDLIPPTPTPATPAWTMVTPAEWAAATELISPSGALTVEPSDDPDWTYKTSFNDTALDSGAFELAIDMTPYIHDDRCTVLVEFGPRPNASATQETMLGIRAAGEAEVVIGGMGHAPIGPETTRLFFFKANVTTGAFPWFRLATLTTQAWFTGLAVDINVGSATESPTAWPRAMGSATTNNAVWPAWLDPDNPRVGDFIGIRQYWSPSSDRSLLYRVDTPRVPATAERKLVIRVSAANSGSAWNDWYHRVAIVNP